MHKSVFCAVNSKRPHFCPLLFSSINYSKSLISIDTKMLWLLLLKLSLKTVKSAKAFFSKLYPKFIHLKYIRRGQHPQPPSSKAVGHLFSFQQIVNFYLISHQSHPLQGFLANLQIVSHLADGTRCSNCWRVNAPVQSAHRNKSLVISTKAIAHLPDHMCGCM